MKKILLFFVFLLVSSSVFCSSNKNIEFSLGSRESITEYQHLTMGARFIIPKIEIGLRYHVPRQFDFAFTNHIYPENNLKQNFHIHVTNINDLGGTVSITYSIGHDFYFFDNHLLLGYRAKIQAGMGYSLYTSHLPLSLSPDGKINISFLSKIFEADAYISFSTLFERTWQATPIIGGSIAFNITEYQKLGLFGNIFFSDFLIEEPYPLITGYTFGLAYTVGGF